MSRKNHDRHNDPKFVSDPNRNEAIENFEPQEKPNSWKTKNTYKKLREAQKFEDFE